MARLGICVRVKSDPGDGLVFLPDLPEGGDALDNRCHRSLLDYVRMSGEQDAFDHFVDDGKDTDGDEIRVECVDLQADEEPQEAREVDG